MQTDFTPSENHTFSPAPMDRFDPTVSEVQALMVRTVECLKEQKNGAVSPEWIASSRGGELEFLDEIENGIQSLVQCLNNFVAEKEQQKYSVTTEVADDKTIIVMLTKDGELISEGPTFEEESQNIFQRLQELRGLSFEDRNQVLTAIGQLLDRAVGAQETEPRTWVERTKSGRKPTADVVVPDKAPKLWEKSAQKKLVDAGKLTLDEAVPAFTAETYKGFLPRECPVGLAITDFNDIDRPLYDQWVALKKRVNGRVDKTWPEGFPFPSRTMRNDFVADAIKAGDLLPPSNPRTYASMKSSFIKLHNMQLDDYLEQQAVQHP